MPIKKLRIPILAVLLLFFHSVLYSNPKAVTWIGLSEAWNESQVAVLATITNESTVRDRFGYTVEKIWAGEAPVSYRFMRDFKEGQKRWGRIYSDTDVRLWGHLESAANASGRRVLLFPAARNQFRLLPYSDLSERKLNALEAAGTLRSLIDEATDSELIVFLSDYDLWEETIKKLAQTNMLSPYILFTNRLPGDRKSLAVRYLETLSLAERENFFISCGAERRAFPEDAQRGVLSLLINNSATLTVKEAAVMLVYIASMDLASRENQSQFGYYLAALDEIPYSVSGMLSAAGAFSPSPGRLAENITAYTVNRQPFQIYEEAIESIAAKLPLSERVHMIELLFNSMTKTPLANFSLGNCDAFLLKICLDWAVREPRMEYLPGLASIPLMDFTDRSACVSTASRILEAAVAADNVFPDASELVGAVRTVVKESGCAP